MAKRRQTNRVRLTQQVIAKAACPPDLPRLEIQDDKQHGLALFVTRSGSKVFYLTVYHGGRLRRWKLGAATAIAPEQARQMAAEIRGELAKGLPVAEIQVGAAAAAKPKQDDPVLADVLEQVQATCWSRNKRTQANQQTLRRYHPALLSRNASEITLAEARRLHAEVGKQHGSTAANRWRTVWVKVFNVARTDFGFRSGNPFADVTPFPESSRKRRLSPAETAAFVAALEAEPQQNAKDLLTVAIMTGARRSNLFLAKFADFDLPGRTWTIPAEQSKNGQELVLPIVDAVVAIVARRQAEANGRPFVFHGRHASRRMTDCTKPFHAVLERAGITAFRFHDLRRTLASWLVDTGASETLTAAALGHSVDGSGVITRVYARPDQDAVRQAVQVAVSAMWAAKPNPVKEIG